MKTDMESLLQRAGGSVGHPPQPKIGEGTGHAEIKERKLKEIDLLVHSSTGVKLTVPQFYYPYWTAQVMGTSTELTVTPSQPDGLMNLSVPAGNHLVRLRLERSKPETVGLVISLLSLGITVSLGLLGAIRESQIDLRGVL